MPVVGPSRARKPPLGEHQPWTLIARECASLLLLFSLSCLLACNMSSSGPSPQTPAASLVANPGGPYNAMVGQPITFDGSKSTASPGQTLTYFWDFGDNSTGTGVSPTHTYSTAGTFNVALTVTDSSGAANSASTTTTVVPGGGGELGAPVISSFSPQGGPIGTVVTIHGQNFSTTSSNDIVQFNGTKATVTAATANSLTVTVPSGATTGPILVSVGSLTTISATYFTVLPATITQLVPNSGLAGQPLSVAVTGQYTNFVNGTTTADFGAGITVNSVNVTTSTAATVSLTISSTAAPGARTVTLTTGGEAASISNGFTVVGSLAIQTTSLPDGQQGVPYSAGILVSGGTQPYTWAVTSGALPDGVKLNTATGVISGTPSVSGTFTITVGVNDSSSPVQTKSASYTFTIVGVAVVTGASPSSGHQGDTSDSITLTGQFTHFVQGQTSVTFGSSDITVIPGSVTVNSATSVTVSISIAVTALIGAHNVAVTTGSEVAVGNSVFTVLAGLPAVSLSPNSGVQGTNPTITITGTFTNFTQGQTTANFGGSDITAGAVTVNSPTQATVQIQISVAASLGQRTISINTGSQSAPGTFTVTAGTPVVVAVSPNVGGQKVSGLNVTVNANFTSWVNQTTLASFGPGIAVGGGPPGSFGPVTVVNSSQFTASISIDANATLGPRTITVQTGTEQEIAAGAFTVENCTTTAAAVLYTSPFSGAGNVPLNTQVQWEFNAPLGRSAINTTSVYLYDTSTGLHVPSTVSLDATGRIVTLAPSQLLGVGRTFYGYLGYGAATTDACGNALSAFTNFTTSFAPETSGPSVVQTSPSNNDTVPLNAQVVLQFSVPVNPLTLQNGLILSTGGNAVPGTYAPLFSNDYTRIVFTPGTALTAGASYTVGYTTQLTDVVGNPLVNPGSFSFTAGTAADTTHGSVTATNPQYGETGIGTNVTPTFHLNKILDPISVETSNSYIYDANTGKLFPSTVTVSADRLSATITPSEGLQPGTTYYLYLCAGPNCYDLAGNYFNSSFLYFTTTGSAITTGPAVTQISPPNGATGTPVNTQVVAVMSGLIDPNTVGNSAITVTPQGSTTPVTGTVTLASDQVTLTWVPSASLATSATYSVSVGGFSDAQGNAAAPFSSSFTTGTNATPVGPGSLTKIAVTPANLATNVSNTAQVVITFSEAVNPATLNNILVRDATAGYYNLAGTWAVTGANGAQVTFTPAQPYPANAQIQVWTQDRVQDLAGNTDTAYVVTTFTVANTADTTAPTVTSVTPTNGATGIGRNAAIVLTFSESINPTTVNGNTIGLFAGITPIGASYTMSANNRTVILSTTWQPATTITVVASQKVQDFSGNSLVPFQSQFTTAADFSTTQPQVVTQRPANGATDVPPNAIVTLFTNGRPLDPSTVSANSLRVSHNGVLIDGTISVSGNNQAIEFVPSQNFNYGDLVQIFLNANIRDVDGNALAAYNGQFTVAGNPVTVGPQLIAANPPYGATNVPTNPVVQVAFDQALASSTINTTNVQLCPGDNCSTPVAGTVSLIGVNNNVIQFVPSSPLTSSTYYYLNLRNVTNAPGVKLGNTLYTYFQTGTATDTTAPTVVSVSPINGTSNVGVNAFALVKFSKAIDPISVTGSTIQVSYGSQPTLVPPVSITFGRYTVAAPDFDYVTVTPQAPLPANTLITVAINGVTDMQGNAVVPQTIQFTTGPRPDTTAPSVVFVNPDYGTSNVPTNAAIVVQFNKQMDTSTICDSPCGSTFLYDTVTGLHVPGTMTFSPDLTSFTFVPSAPLLVNRTYYVYVESALDLTGNPQSNFVSYFTTSFAASSTIPAVVNTNPENNLTGVPVNTVVEVLFNEPIRPETITNVTLLQGGTPVSVNPSLSQGDMLVSLTPNALLLPNAPYTISVNGVQDFAGHTQSGSFSSTFTTGPTFDVANGSVTATDPTYGQSGVGTNTLIRVFFSERINPISLQLVAPTIYTYDTGRYLPISLTSIAADRLSATFTPGIPLQPFTTYGFNLPTIYDVAGNYVSGTGLYFTTGAGAITTGPSVSSISPPNGTTSTPVNTHVVAVMSAPIDPTTVNNSSITVTPNGSSTAVPATVSVASDLVTLTWVPTSNLATSTTYNVSVSGFQDSEGNPVIPFTSSFTTGTNATPVGPGSLTAIAVTPANLATNVSNTAQVVITFSEAVNPATLNNILVRDASAGYNNLAGTWAVTGANGAQVTFTPAQPYPANAQIQVWTQDRVQDLAGNTDTAYVVTTFTVGSTPDTSAPTVISVSPANGTTNVGRDVKVVLTFSKSVNPATVSGSTIHVLAGDTAINVGGVMSADNRTFSLNTSDLAASTTYTVVATSQVQDFSGNALQYFQSQFTTGPLISATGPAVVTQRPANGATDVPANTVITLYTNGAPLNPSTVTGNSLRVSQNGVLVSGSITLSGNNQAIEFTPSSDFTPGSVVTIHMDQTVTDVNSVPLTGVYSGQFTVAGNPASVGPQLIATNPPYGATNVPTNPVVQVEFDQALASTTVNATNVLLCPLDNCSTPAAGTVSLIGVNNNAIQFVPSSPLTSSTDYYLNLRNVTNAQGVPLSNTRYTYFQTGTATNTTAPSVLSVGPPNNATGVGVNASIVVTFNNPIDPVSINASTIQVSGGSQTVVPSSINFGRYFVASPNFDYVSITPQAPLPANTTMAIAINGVTDPEGNAVTAQTTHFTTGAAPDLTAPSVVLLSWQYGGAVATNASFSEEFNEPMDPGTVNSTTFLLYDVTVGGPYLPATVTLSPDLKTETVTPNSPLTPGHQIYVYSQNAQDLAGNTQNSTFSYANVGSGTDTTPPVVLETNPPANFTGVPLNVPVQIEFSQEIAQDTIGNVQLLQGGSPVAVTASFSRMNAVLTLTPNMPLAANTTYTISIAGVTDTAGNVVAAQSQSFTTGGTIKLSAPVKVSVTPCCKQTGVPDNTTIQIVFDSPMDSLTFDTAVGSAVLELTSTSAVVPTTVSFSLDYKTVILTPSAPLAPSTSYTVVVNYGQVTDMAGNVYYNSISESFTAQ